MHYLLRLYYTLRPLKGRQWWYRLTQPAMKKCSRLCSVTQADIAIAMQRPGLSLISLPVNKSYEPSGKEFCFLNLKAAFPHGINWNYSAHGLLWLYNLHYFEWLYDDRLSVEDRRQTIHRYVEEHDGSLTKRHSYPTSLRIVAWTRFLLRCGINDERICSTLYQHAGWLCRFPEYHLDGNHLWENAAAMIHAGIFFHNSHFYQKGKALLTECLCEQLFADGGHKEGSPMYHSLLLWRVMQCIEIARALPLEQDDLLSVMEQAAEKMLGWISKMTFRDGMWPAANDCTCGIAPTSREIAEYARQLHLDSGHHPLRDSQYRMIRSPRMELFVDAADIRPAYQPGHAHADTGTFCLHMHGRPFIVDTGISTYTEGALRMHQRSTAAHNTMCINGRNSSDTWKSFRVGKRACINEFHESNNEIVLSYAYAFAIHTRTFSWTEDNLSISDLLESRASCDAMVNLHFHPDVALTRFGDAIHAAEGLRISFKSAMQVEILDYNWAGGFNKLRKAQYISVTVSGDRLITNIQII